MSTLNQLLKSNTLFKIVLQNVIEDSTKQIHQLFLPNRQKTSNDNLITTKITINTSIFLNILRSKVVYNYLSEKYMSKYKCFISIIDDNFLKDKNEFTNIFCKTQKIYFALNKFYNICCFKQKKIVIDRDIYLNKISRYNKKVIQIYQSDYIYLFTMNDLYKILKMSLVNNEYLFSNPLNIKNPYNNLPFSVYNLYNIYFFLKEKYNYTSNELFDEFFRCGFNIDLFKHNNEVLLRKECIKDYIENSDEKIIEIEILNMIARYNYKLKYKHKIIIHKKFPIKKLIKIMKPYLHIYFKCWYSLATNDCDLYYKEIKHRLYFFHKFNPNFGRIRYLINYTFDDSFKKKLYIGGVEFNTQHIRYTDDINFSFDGYYKYIELLDNSIKSNNNNDENYQYNEVDDYDYDYDDYYYDDIEYIREFDND